MKNTTKKEQRTFELKQQLEIQAWYQANSHLLDAEIENEVISFDDAEEIRLHIYDVDSFRKSKRQSVSAKEDEEVVNYTETAYLEDMQQENDEDEDFIFDLGGNEAKVEKQYKAAILCGNYDLVTKRSSVYEDGGGLGLVRLTSDLNGNDNLFMAAGEERDFLAKEDRIAKGYAKQLADRFDARRIKEVEMRDYAIERYSHYASMLQTAEDVENLAKNADYVLTLVRADLQAKFGKQYIYMSAKYEFKGKKYGSFDMCFHDSMYAKYIKPVKDRLQADKRRDAYLKLLESVQTLPVSSNKHLAWLVANKHRECGIDTRIIKDALGYAWDNKESVEQFDKQVYFALKQIAA